MVRSTFLLLFAALCAPLAMALEKGQAEGAHSLTSDNFKAKTGKGLWLVEHYSPYCGHCRHFAPTMEKLVKAHRRLENTRGFHMAQVNCVAQGDLCNDNGIKYYPMIKLYEDGVEKETYAGDRSFENLNDYIEKQSLEYVLEHGKRLATGGKGVDGESVRGVNEDGEVKELGVESLAQLIKDGPAYVKFMAPWCGHCKKLAPKWTELAKNLKGKLNVGEVNCEELGGLCKKEKILGYPTIKLYHNGGQVEYMGPRTVEGMQDFAEKTLRAGELTHIDHASWPAVAAKEDVYFVLLQTFKSDPTYATSVKDAITSLASPVAVYETHDPDLFKGARIDAQHGTVLAAFKDNSTRPVDSLTLTSTSSTKPSISAFIEGNRHPLLLELTTKNYDAIFKSSTRPLIVLAALKKSSRGFDADLARFRDIARAWYKGGRKFKQPVWFVWADGTKWKKWFGQTYGVSKRNLPSVVLVDPHLNEYYDTTIEKAPLTFDGASVFSTLEGAYQHFIRPKFSETLLERQRVSLSMSFRTIGLFIAHHPLSSLISLGAAFACIMWMLQKLLPAPAAASLARGGRGGAGVSQEDGILVRHHTSSNTHKNHQPYRRQSGGSLGGKAGAVAGAAGASGGNHRHLFSAAAASGGGHASMASEKVSLGGHSTAPSSSAAIKGGSDAAGGTRLD